MNYEVVRETIGVRFYDSSVPLYLRRYVYARMDDFVQVLLRNGRVVSGYVRGLYEDYMLLSGVDERVFFWAVAEIENLGKEFDNAF